MPSEVTTEWRGSQGSTADRTTAAGRVEPQAERTAAMCQPLAGTPEQLAARLRPSAAAGLAYAILYFPRAAYDLSDLELFAREVTPAFA